MMASSPNPDRFLTQARFTPLRDVIRGRMTGRLNLRRIVDEAGLPQPLAQLVLYVTRRTRLWRIEKSDVARELTAHFADGLDAGKSTEQLRRDFGDPDQAARLIRRAKARNHSMLRRLPRFAMYALGVLALFYLVIAIRFFAGSPNPTYDYLADLNRIAIESDPSDHGWPVYRRALLMLDEQPPWPEEGESRPGTASWPHMQTYLEENAQALAIVREAASYAHLGYVAGHVLNEEDQAVWPDVNPGEAPSNIMEASLIGVQLPHLNSLRQLGRLLVADCHRAAQAGDDGTIVANLGAILGISEHARDAPTLIGELVSFAIIDLASRTAGELIDQQPTVFSDDSLRQLAHRFGAAHGGGRLRLDISSERMFFHDLVQRMFTDDGHGNGRMTAEGVQFLQSIMTFGDPMADTPGDLRWYSKAALPAVTLLLANRRDMLAKYDALLDRVERESQAPLWQWENTVEADVQSMHGDPLQMARYAPIYLMMPAMSKATVRGEQTTMMRDAILVAIALELHRRRNGQWPASLDQMVPDLLPAVPFDRFDGNALRYRIVDGSPVVYSIGSNLEDNGGQPSANVQFGYGGMNPASRWMHPSTVESIKRDPQWRTTSRLPDGDWILWPPVIDEQPPIDPALQPPD